MLRYKPKLVIHSAYYGTGPQTDFDVTDIVKRGSSGESMALWIDNNAFGKDPHIGEPKELKVHYSYGNNNHKSIIRPESSYLILPEDEWLKNLYISCQEQLDEKRRAADRRDDIIKIRDEQIQELKAHIASAQIEKSSPVSLQLSKPKPILEHIGLETIVNVRFFDALLPNVMVSLYVIKIRNSQFDVMMTASNTRARIEFQHETGGFVVQEAAWVDQRQNYPDHVRIWARDSADIDSADCKELIVAGMHLQPPEVSPPVVSWSVHVKHGDVERSRILGFGKWTCAVTVEADLLESVHLTVSFNIDSGGRLLNFGSQTATA